MALLCLERKWDTKELRRDRPSPVDANHSLPLNLWKGSPTMSGFSGGHYMRMPNVEDALVHLAFH